MTKICYPIFCLRVHPKKRLTEGFLLRNIRQKLLLRTSNPSPDEISLIKNKKNLKKKILLKRKMGGAHDKLL